MHNDDKEMYSRQTYTASYTLNVLGELVKLCEDRFQLAHQKDATNKHANKNNFPKT